MALKLFKEFLVALIKWHRRDMLMPFLTALAMKRHYKICGRIIAGRFRLMCKSKSKDSNSPIYNIIYLYKGGLQEDVLESLGKSNNFNIYRAHRTDLQAIFRAFLPPTVQDYNYISSDPAIETAKKAYRDFLNSVWDVVLKLKPHHAVLSGNVVYYAEREFADMLEAKGVPFICLHKECLKILGMLDYFTSKYQSHVGPFKGRAVTVYNEIERESQIKGGIVTPDRISVTGMPRLDRYHAWRKGPQKSSNTETQVLAFMFSRHTSLFRLPEPASNPSSQDMRACWDVLLSGYVHALLNLARKHPDIKVILKSKGVPGGISALRREIFGSEIIPSNLEIITGGDPFRLIIESRVVCGFNTTTLLESIAAGIPVVVPNFGETRLDEMRPYVIDLEDAVEQASSPEVLTLKLAELSHKNNSRTTELSSAQVRMLDKWLGNSDGKSGDRVVTAVMKEILSDIN